MEGDQKKQETTHLLEEAETEPDPSLRKDEDDEEDGPRMGDLIRQAMPCKLARSPSLPSCRIKKEVAAVAGGLPREPTMSKLTRRSSMNPSLLLPTKKTSKGVKQGSSAPGSSKNHQQIRSEMGSRNMEGNQGSRRRRSLERSMSLKSLSDKEVQGFLELGFTFDKEDLSSSVVGKLASFQIKEETDEEEEATQSSSSSPAFPKLVGSKSSAEEMKAQIKFWARAVTSNVHQECLSPR